MDYTASFWVTTTVRILTLGRRLLFTRLSAADASQTMMSTPFAGAATMQPGQPQDFNKLFKAEQDNLEFAEGVYSWVANDIETRILKKYGRKV